MITPSTRPALPLVLILIAVSFGIFVSVAISHTRLVEDRGVIDDICYLRQAHLFRTHGLIGGLDTDNAPARYVFKKANELGLTGLLPTSLPCHSYIAATDKMVMQYPPGTGAMLALFAPFSQATGLYLLGSTIILLLVCGAILTAATLASLAATCATGWLTLYMMVNPGKSSYSMALTMPLCIVLAIATVQMFAARSQQWRYAFAALAGLLLGIGVTVRLSSAFLAAGFLIVFAVRAARRRTLESLVQPVLFGAMALVGMLPEFAANVVNTGNPFVTAYGGGDTAAPDLSWANLETQIRWYFSHTHGVVTLLALGALAAALATLREHRAALWIASATLLINLAYFLTHTISSQYYSVPPALFGLWTAVVAFHGASSATQPRRDLGNARRAAILAAVAIGIGSVWLWLGAPRAPLPPPSDVAFEPQAVVWVEGEGWSNGPGRQFEYRLKRHAASGLDRLPRAAQDKIIGAVAADRRPQYFVAADDGMKEIVNRIGAPLAGRAFGLDVYRYPAR